MSVVILKRYDGTRRTSAILDPESCTDDSYKDECDINQIISRCVVSGQPVVSMTNAKGEYIDVSTLSNTYLDSRLRAAEIDTYFNSLPSNIRKMYNNDIEYFLKNYDPAHFETPASSAPAPTAPATDSTGS